MENIIDKLRRFMYGRYGIDQLSYALFATYFVLAVINSFANLIIISILNSLVLIYMFFRIFSRNIYKRRLENEKFLKYWKPIKSKSFFTIRRVKEIKTHRFRKCPHCKAMLRLPRKAGKHTAICPRCHSEFKVHIL
ncbi:MAG: hypothetical protein GX383_11905 [Clostridium sp.]|mgnify:CR=1 FL=1|jgi:hypothetical protein|nr:hypothetical protein [Clostridium sp.]